MRTWVLVHSCRAYESHTFMREDKQLFVKVRQGRLLFGGAYCCCGGRFVKWHHGTCGSLLSGLLVSFLAMTTAIVWCAVEHVLNETIMAYHY